VEANPTADALNEFFRGVGATTLSPGQALNLGGLFNETSGSQDLELQFALAGDVVPRFGVVQYTAISAAVPGDYNNNGVVDAGDYTIWRDHLGQTFQLQNEGGITPGVVNAADYAFWKANFGNGTPGAGAAAAGRAAVGVPEPASSSLVLAATVVACGIWSRRRQSCGSPPVCVAARRRQSGVVKG
jgi:hypothetical protein